MESVKAMIVAGVASRRRISGTGTCFFPIGQSKAAITSNTGPRAVSIPVR